MTERIKENRDFRRLYSRGKSFVSPCVVLYCAPNRNKITRIGVACSKKVGCAVKRNRAKRVLRAAFSQVEPMIKEGYDILLVARSSTPHKKSTQVAESLTALLNTAGVLK